MHTPKAVFIDFDGTYADHGVVPPPHVDAVREARRNGHRIFLCTGRPRSMVPDRVLDGVFDGLVSSAGGYAAVDGQVLCNVRFPPDLGSRLVASLDRHNVLYVLEAPEAIYARSADESRLFSMLGDALQTEQGRRDLLARLMLKDDLSTQSYGKITCFSSDTPLRVIAEEFAPEVALLPSSLPDLGDGAGEFYLPQVNKAVGIEVVTSVLGVDRADVIAIGDGHNDVEMLEYAGTGVAVAGAPEVVLAHASMVIGGPADGGVAWAFTELGLI